MAGRTADIIIVIICVLLAVGIYANVTSDMNYRRQLKEANAKITKLENEKAIYLHQIEDESATLTALRQTNGVLGALSKTLEGVDIVPREAVRGKR